MGLDALAMLTSHGWNSFGRNKKENPPTEAVFVRVCMPTRRRSSINSIQYFLYVGKVFASSAIPDFSSPRAPVAACLLAPQYHYSLQGLALFASITTVDNIATTVAGASQAYLVVVKDGKVSCIILLPSHLRKWFSKNLKLEARYLPCVHGSASKNKILPLFEDEN